VEQKVFHCEKCGAPYLEGVTICYSCGAPIGEPEQPTQPVRLPAHLRARTATVPLPPATVATQASRETISPGALAGPPNTAWWERIDTRVRPLSVALLAVSLVLLVAGVVVLNERLIPPQVALHHVYRDPAHRFHVVQPELWQATPYAGGAVLSDATGVTQVLINVSPAGYGETAAKRAAALRQALGLRAASDLVEGEVSWVRSIGTLQSANGAESEMLVLVSQRGDTLYIVECSSPIASFDAETRLVFLPLLQSFAFG
jgi:hypothetical protein